MAILEYFCNDFLVLLREGFKKGIKYIRRKDLESKLDCTIWIQVTPPRQKPFLFMGGYRQWNFPKDINPEYTGSSTLQLHGGQSIIRNWNTAIMENK